MGNVSGRIGIRTDPVNLGITEPIPDNKTLRASYAGMVADGHPQVLHLVLPCYMATIMLTSVIATSMGFRGLTRIRPMLRHTAGRWPNPARYAHAAVAGGLSTASLYYGINSMLGIPSLSNVVHVVDDLMHIKGELTKEEADELIAKFADTVAEFEKSTLGSKKMFIDKGGAFITFP